MPVFSLGYMAGMVWPELSFHTLVYADIAVKLAWGTALLTSGRPPAAGASANAAAITK